VVQDFEKKRTIQQIGTCDQLESHVIR